MLLFLLHVNHANHSWKTTKTTKFSKREIHTVFPVWENKSGWPQSFSQSFEGYWMSAKLCKVETSWCLWATVPLICKKCHSMEYYPPNFTSMMPCKRTRYDQILRRMSPSVLTHLLTMRLSNMPFPAAIICVMIVRDTVASGRRGRQMWSWTRVVFSQSPCCLWNS